MVLSLFALLLGSIWGCESYFLWLSTKSMRVESLDPVAELFFWECIDPDALRYWPVFFTERGEIRSRIERISPLKCTISRRGVAGTEISIEPLVPWIMAKWGDKEYFVARDGSAWDRSLQLNSVLKGIKPPANPPFIFTDDFPPPFAEDDSVVVKRAVFSMDTIDEWLRGLSALGWGLQVEKIFVARREGRELVRLVLNRGASHILIWGEAGGWRGLKPALSQIVEQLHFLGDDIIIDTTYTDRIIVRSAERGDQEGSGK